MASVKCVKCQSDVADTDAFCMYCGVSAEESRRTNRSPSKVASKNDVVLLDVKGDSNGQVKKPVRNPAAVMGQGKKNTQDVVNHKKMDGQAKREMCPSCDVALVDNSDHCLICSYKIGDPVPEMKKNTKQLPLRKGQSVSNKSSKPSPTKKQQSTPAMGSSRSSHNSAILDQDTRNMHLMEASDGSGHIRELDALWVPNEFSNDCMNCHQVFGFPKPRRHRK